MLLLRIANFFWINVVVFNESTTFVMICHYDITLITDE